MLVYFTIENFLSIRDKVEFSFVPSAFFKECQETLLDCRGVPGGKLLPSAIIYGPNASGKSNIIAGLSFIQSAIIHSHTRGSPEGGVPRHAFALSAACAKRPTAVELEFILDDVRYQYGFKATDELFPEEWLYFYPRDRRQLLFERTGQKVKFGRTLKGQNKVISELMRPNSLFLSAAAQNGHEQLSKVRHFFSSVELEPTEKKAISGKDEDKFDSRIIEFLEKIGTGVTGFRRRKIEKSENDITDELRTLLARRFNTSLDEVKISTPDFTLELAHKGDGEEPVYFQLSKESAGTRRLLGLLASIFLALDNGDLLVIDELDESLHTQIGDAILALFDGNTKGAQLIATTHDTNLMGSRCLRRDQVWFTEKDRHGATHLFPLSDIRTRNTDNIEKGYLQGRYGAIPFSGHLEKLLKDKM